MSEGNLKLSSSNNRIAVLDGFRTIAILSVILYHYFYRWNDSEYPYFGGNYFHYGFKGVPFFFMISGFVICYSLEGTQNSIVFWKKRFIRLFPSMLIASVLTFVFLNIFNKNEVFADTNNLRNLLTSITFLPPNIFDFLLGTKNHFSYLNFSYWSLWPEIQFYFLASTIYFIDKSNFKKNFIIVCFTVLVIYNALLLFDLTQIKVIEKLVNLFNLIQNLPFFLSGALFYMLYKNKHHIVYIFFLALPFIVMNLSLIIAEVVAYTIMFSLFFCFIYFPRVLAILENKFIATIGISSYFLYLIHENIGVVWIRNSVSYFYPYSFIAPILIMIIMIFFSIIYTKKIELKIGKYLNNRLLKKANV